MRNNIETQTLEAPKKRNRLLTALALLFAIMLSVLAGWLLLEKPSAALDDGHFCISGTYIDGGQKGMAGHKTCGENQPQPEVPVIPAPVPAAISQPCFIGGNMLARNITLKWKAADDKAYTIEYAKLVDGKMEALPAGVKAETTGAPSDHTTVISGTGVLPSSGSASYSLRLTDGARSSAWITMTGTAPAVGSTTCSISVG